MRIDDVDVGWDASAWEVVHADRALADDGLPRRAALTGVRPHWGALVERLPLAALDGLSFANARLSADELLPLARRADAASIRALRLPGNAIDRDGLHRLVATPLFHGLEELDLGDNPIGPAGLWLIAAAVPSLVRLALPELGLDTTTTAAALPRLRWLELARNPLGSAALERVLGDLEAPLEVLDLSLTQLAVRPTRDLGSLRALGVGRNALDGAAIARMIEPARDRVRWLDAGWTRAGDPLLSALAAIAPPALRTLAAENAAITSAGAIALSRAHLPALAQLELANNQIDEAGARALSAWRGAPRLADCDLRGNPVPPAIAREIYMASPRVRFRAIE